MSGRAGKYIQQTEKYKAFIPKPLPPDPPLKTDSELQVLLSSADRAVGGLDTATRLLPNPDLFVSLYVRKEAVFSSQIEGTQASLSDLLEFEAKSIHNGLTSDVQETFNYVKAMNYGLDRLDSLPLSLRLIKEVHSKLLRGVRGGDRNPGEYRNSQNWIGAPGCNLSDAVFVPPPPHEIAAQMGELELFIHDDAGIPPLIKCGLVHAQFETIHPFLDGNGRIGRLLITFILCWRKVLKRPLLYLSHYFKQNRDEYCKRLQNVRDKGHWENWMLFFLEGVRTVALQATETAIKIQELREGDREKVGQLSKNSGLILLDYLYKQPYVNISEVGEIIGRSYPVASRLIVSMENMGLLEEITGGERYKIYAYQPYLELFDARIRKRK
ncbi:Fic domain protein, Pden_3305 type [hydrothermal vent metagenome]|uniref:Fic domain protein, Pden_3305 type n=1 Tax=hydrothermal vent metagenome TaxID=652676 RepID=A0A3B1CSA4_9ZZZZ